MALEYGTFGFGGAVYPLATGTGHSLLQDADPGLWKMLDYYASVLQLQLGARWSEACTAAGLTSMASAIVAYKIPYEPSRYLAEDQIALPVLAVYRTSETFTDHTNEYGKSTTKVHVDWAMPPLTAAQMEQIGPALQAVARVLRQQTERGNHPSYNAGERVWDVVGVQLAFVESVAYENLVGSSNLYFPAASLTVSLLERVMPITTAFDPIAGVDTAVNVASPVDTTLADVVDLQTNNP